MANKGRTYERLFERDFGYRHGLLFLYLPARYGITLSPGLGSNCIRYQNGRFATDYGVADYDAGIVSWLLTPPAPITPGAYVRLEYQLTYDEPFFRFRQFYGIGTTDWWYRETVGFNGSFPNVGLGTQNWVISPVPSCVPSSFGATVWRWWDV